MTTTTATTYTGYIAKATIKAVLFVPVVDGQEKTSVWIGNFQIESVVARNGRVFKIRKDKGIEGGAIGYDDVTVTLKS